MKKNAFMHIFNSKKNEKHDKNEQFEKTKMQTDVNRKG